MLNRFREVLQMLAVNHTGFGKSIAETFVELVFGMIEHGRPAYSIFTYGLDLLRSILRRKIVAPISLHISPHFLTPWPAFLNLLFSFILGHKNVGY